MKRLFQVMADKKASDIFLSVGAPINIKINGIAVPVNQAIMSADTVRQLLYEVLNERQIKEYEDEMELNTAISMGVFLGQSTRILERATGQILYGRVPAGSVVVSGNLPSPDGSHGLYCAVIVKKVDARTRAKTSLNELLRGD